MVRIVVVATCTAAALASTGSAFAPSPVLSLRRPGAASTTRRYVLETAPEAASVSLDDVAAVRAAGRGRAPVLTLPGDTLELTPKMLALTYGTTAAYCLGMAAALAAAPVGALGGLCLGVLGADLFSGAFHWATDNYGDIDTPVVGFACAAFQGHHLAPWTITHRPFANNVHNIAKAAAVPMAVAFAALSPAAGAFVGTTLYGQLWAQEFHRWSHMLPSELPPAAQFLQRCGAALSVAEHGRHHLPPYAKHYTIFTGMLNPLLDTTFFWRRVEAAVYRANGAEPNCWKDLDNGGAKLKALALSL